MQEFEEIDIIAHRAGNSVKTFMIAIENGATMVETDVHITRDGVLIAQYLPYIERGNNKIYLYDCDYDEFVNDNLVMLKDILILAQRNNVKVLADIKKGKVFYSEIGRRLAELVDALNMINIVEAISFDHKCIMEIKKYSHMRVGIMYVARLCCLQDILKICDVDFVEICGDYLDDDAINIAHNLNVDVYGWGTDDSKILRQYKGAKMRAVTVNDVKAAISILHS